MVKIVLNKMGSLRKIMGCTVTLLIEKDPLLLGHGILRHCTLFIGLKNIFEKRSVTNSHLKHQKFNIFHIYLL